MEINDGTSRIHSHPSHSTHHPTPLHSLVHSFIHTQQATSTMVLIAAARRALRTPTVSAFMRPSAVGAQVRWINDDKVGFARR